MKRFIYIIMIMVVAIIFTTTNLVEANVNNDAKALVSSYYNEGVYTKKTQMYLTEDAIVQFKDHFHVNATSDRTTYYSGDYLLMGDYDGGFDVVNSGYMNDGANIAHFEYSGDINNPISKKYTSIKGTSIEDYFVALDDMLEEGYFDNFEYNGNQKYVYTVVAGSGVEEKLHDFLWFSAPGLEDSIFGNANGYNYFSQEGIKLVLEEKSHEYYGSYLSIRILLDVLDIGKVKTPEELENWETGDDGYIIPEGEELVLSEARVYKGLNAFDEGHVHAFDEGVINGTIKTYTCKDCSYKKEVKLYTVRWYSSTGTVYHRDENVEEGTIPVYDYKIPQKASDDYYTYEFVGWSLDKEIVLDDLGVVNSDLRFYPVYENKPILYTIKWENPDGTVLKEEQLEYGVIPTAPTPTLETTEQYEFLYWSSEVSEVTKDTTYVAVYLEKDIEYSDFGAVGDGVADDFIALYKAHVYANATGAYEVLADKDMTYYICNTVPSNNLIEWINGIIDGKHTTNHNHDCIYGAHKEHVTSYGVMTDCHGNIVTNELKTWATTNLASLNVDTAITIPVETNTNWNNAKFIIDDTFIAPLVVVDGDASKPADLMFNKDIFTLSAGNYNIREFIPNASIASSLLKTMTQDEFDALIAKKPYLQKLNQQIIAEGIGPHTTKLNLGLGYPATIIIQNEDLLEYYNNDGSVYSVYRTIAGKETLVGSQRVYIREGNNANGGEFKSEVINIDAEGNIDPSTPIMFDYTRIKYVLICDLRIPEITVSGGEFTTLAPQGDARFSINSDGSINNSGTSYKYGYIRRGIHINRSNVVINGVKHYVENELSLAKQYEGIEGAHYAGFFYAELCGNVTLSNCVLTGRRNYSVTGSYDFTADTVSGIYLKNCTQSNFWVIENEDGSVLGVNEGDSGAKLSMENAKNYNKKQIIWGVGRSNFSKNMEYHNSTLTRFDAHQGLYNGKVINSTVTGISIVGKGNMYVENTRILSARAGLQGNSVINLRSDYGSTWDGDIYIKNVEATSSGNGTHSNYAVVFYKYANHYFGYDCYLPNLDVKNFTLNGVENVTNLYLFGTEGDVSLKYASSMHKETLSDGTANLNVINMPQKITVDVTNKYQYILNYRAEGESFNNVETTKCNIKWLNYDGTLVEEDETEYGINPSYDRLKSDGSLYQPYRPTIQSEWYSFVGWSTDPNASYLDAITDFSNLYVTGDTIYYAIHKPSPKQYKPTFNDEDGTLLLAGGSYKYGSTITKFPPTPTKESDGTYKYELYGWNKTITWLDGSTTTSFVSADSMASEVILGTVTYTAVYKEIPLNSVTVNYLDINGNKLLESKTESYGSGELFEINVPEVSGYIPNQTTVKGYVNGNEVVNIYYSVLSSWNGGVSSSLTGSGEKGNPYLIKSADDLAYVKNNASTFEGKYLKMMVSVDVSSNPNFSISSFGGVFDGNNCLIKGLAIESTTSNAGLFKELTATGVVKNLTIYGSVTGVGVIGGIVGHSEGKVENCHNYATVKGNGQRGGVVGYSTGEIYNCANYGEIKNNTSGWNVGGIVGQTTAVVTNCNNFGNVEGITTGVAGIVGETTANIINCVNTGSVTSGNSGGVAGIVGYAKGSSVTDCVNFGAVKGGTRAAGVVSEAQAAVTNCINYGNVTGENGTAGVIGKLYNYNVSGCSNYGVVSGTNTVAGIIAEIPWISGASRTVTNCNNYGEIKGTKYFGGAGIVGTANQVTISYCNNYGFLNSTGDCIGGIAAAVYNTATVKNCNNYGSISAKTNIGGIVYGNYGLITNCNNYGVLMPTNTNPTIGGIYASNVLVSNGKTYTGTMTDCNDYAAKI